MGPGHTGGCAQFMVDQNGERPVMVVKGAHPVRDADHFVTAGSRVADREDGGDFRRRLPRTGRDHVWGLRRTRPRDEDLCLCSDSDGHSDGERDVICFHGV